jgi:DNA-binding sugar fermentation-stimulating protein
MASGQFVLQIVGITDGKIINRPSLKLPLDMISDVWLNKENKQVLTHTPSLGCNGLADANTDVLVAYCPNDEINTGLEIFTHTVFLSVFKENDENEQIIAIHPNISMELMESIIEKNLISVLPPVKQFKRYVPMKMEGKVDSCFSFVGICEDDIPFVMDVNNVPFAEYNHGENVADASIDAAADWNTKSDYFPEKNNKNTEELIKRIKDITMIRRESVVRCIIAYIIQRTDIDKFEFSMYDDEYRAAVKEAIECGVDIVPLVISWTKEGIAFFVTDELSIVYPQI